MKNYKLLDFEVNLINDEDIKKLVSDILKYKVPDYIETEWASSTGKYHPTDENGNPETILAHTKSVVRVAKLLIDHPFVGRFLSNTKKDLIIAACILHDTCKYGFPNKNGKYTLHEHPILIKDLYPYVIKSGENEKNFNKICKLIESHHGPWRTNSYSDVTLPRCMTYSQYVVHMADYIASRKIIKVDKSDTDEIRKLLS